MRPRECLRDESLLEFSERDAVDIALGAFTSGVDDTPIVCALGRGVAASRCIGDNAL